MLCCGVAADSLGREVGVSGSTNGDSRGGGAPGALQEQWNYTEAEAQRSMRRCVALRLHESWEAGGWTTTPYYAGHVLGAAMLHAQLPGGSSVVYTGPHVALHSYLHDEASWDSLRLSAVTTAPTGKTKGPLLPNSKKRA